MEFSEDKLKESLPELPWQKRERYKKEWGIKDEDIEVYVTNSKKEKEFNDVVLILKNHKLAQVASNYILTDLKRDLPASIIAEIIKILDEGVLSSRGAKDLLKIIPETETDVRKFAEKNNLLQISDKDVLRKIVQEVITENKKDAPVQFLVGQAMGKTKNQANPKILQELFVEMLNH